MSSSKKKSVQSKTVERRIAIQKKPTKNVYLNKLTKSPLTVDDCIVGVPLSEIKNQMYSRDFEKFGRFMAGQTVGKYEKNETMIYVSDLERFLKGLPVID